VKANPTNWTVVRSWKFDREGAEEVRRRQVHTLTRWRYGGIDFGMMIVMEWPAFNIPQVQVGHDQRRHERDVCDAKLYAFQVTSARIGL